MISPLAAQQLLRLNTKAYFPVLLKVEDAVFDGGVLRLVNNETDLVYDGETYRAASFRFTPPKYSDKKISNGTLQVSTINQEVIVAIRTMQSRASAQVVAAFYYDDDGTLTFESMEEWSFQLAKVSWGDIVATWEMIYDDVMENNAIADRLTPQKCPALA